MDVVITREQNQNQDLTLEQLVQKHAVMVKRIAYHLLARLPRSIQLDDLVQSGMIGLIEAAKNYDGSKGASFETYAGIRIRGMMLDDVRKHDWLPRSVYRNARRISQVVHDLENQLGRDVRGDEIAKAMDVSLDEYHDLVRDTSCGQIYGFDDIGLTDDMFSDGFAAHIPGPLENVIRDDLDEKIADLVAMLPERERLVLSLYYEEDLNLKEIGAILEVSESRVCQIHSQAMSRLNARLPHQCQ